LVVLLAFLLTEDGDVDMEDTAGAGDGGAPARSGGSAASEGVRSAGQEGKAYAAFLVQ